MLEALENGSGGYSAGSLEALPALLATIKAADEVMEVIPSVVIPRDMWLLDAYKNYEAARAKLKGE